MEPIGKTIVITSRQVRRIIGAKYLDNLIAGLNYAQGHVLGYISHHEGVTATDLQKHFGLSKSSVSEILTVLVKEGYLTYEKSDSDARCRVIALTEKAELIREKQEQASQQFETRLKKGISQEDEEAFYRVIATIEKNLEEMK